MHTLVTIIAFFFILSLLVFVHELGHFAVAKWMGMRVDEFAIGFPPRIITKRYKGTLYALNAVLFGGYVRIHGENGDIDDDPGSFEKKSVWARMAVIVAGVTMNLLFAFVILTVAFSVGFVSATQDNLAAIPGAVVTHADVLVSDTVPGSGAANAGLKTGDIIKSVTSTTSHSTTPVSTTADLVAATKQSQAAGEPAVDLTIDRDGITEVLHVAVAKEGTPIGVYIQPYNAIRVPVWRAPGVAIKEMWGIIGITWDALKGFATKLVTKAQLDPNVSGPVGIYQATGAATQAGTTSTIFLIVALSINLALLNILPIPALDGGKFVFLITEAIFGKRVVSRRIESAVTFAGFVLVMSLLLILSVRDIIKL